jgi:predicted RNA-binding protein with PUA-like domain
MNHWLMKSEPDVFSLQDLKKDRTTWWTGVRNYQARNFMTQQMKPGDLVLFYHSNATPPGIAGLAKVSQSAKADPTAFDKKSEYYDPKSTLEKPIWECVQVEFQEEFSHFITLQELREHPELQEMLVLKKGQRLSIQPVDKKHFEFLCKQGRAK